MMPQNDPLILKIGYINVVDRVTMSFFFNSVLFGVNLLPSNIFLCCYSVNAYTAGIHIFLGLKKCLWLTIVLILKYLHVHVLICNENTK
jgi:hypothetical protein